MFTAGRVADLGDYPPAFAAWASAVKALGGVVTTWPASLAPTSLAGKPAARYSGTVYAQLFNTRKIDTSAPQTAAPSGYVYVLAPNSAIVASQELTKPTAAEAPLYTETLWEKFGLPDIRRPILVGIGVVAAIAAGKLLLGGGRRG